MKKLTLTEVLLYMVQSLTFFKMKTTIEKRWWGKITTQRLKSNYGLIDQRKAYLFGIRGLGIILGNNRVTIPDNIEEFALCQIFAERQVSFSEMSANLPELSNVQFDQFQQEIYPTRF